LSALVAPVPCAIFPEIWNGLDTIAHLSHERNFDLLQFVKELFTSFVCTLGENEPFVVLFNFPTFRKVVWVDRRSLWVGFLPCPAFFIAFSGRAQVVLLVDSAEQTFADSVNFLVVVGVEWLQGRACKAIEIRKAFSMILFALKRPLIILFSRCLDCIVMGG